MMGRLFGPDWGEPVHRNNNHRRQLASQLEQAGPRSEPGMHGGGATARNRPRKAGAGAKHTSSCCCPATHHDHVLWVNCGRFKLARRQLLARAPHLVAVPALGLAAGWEVGLDAG